MTHCVYIYMLVGKEIWIGKCEKRDWIRSMTFIRTSSKTMVHDQMLTSIFVIGGPIPLIFHLLRPWHVLTLPPYESHRLYIWWTTEIFVFANVVVLVVSYPNGGHMCKAGGVEIRHAILGDRFLDGYLNETEEVKPKSFCKLLIFGWVVFLNFIWWPCMGLD